MSKPALAIMTRVPSPGGKSRLKDVLTEEQREQLQWAFLLDAVEKTKHFNDIKCFIAATPENRIDKLRDFFGGSIEVIPQPLGDLGRRMYMVIHPLFNRGYTPILVVGTDTPTLPPAFLLKAVEMLGGCQTVIGPSVDGGYYLIGMNKPEERLFQNIDWGTSSVLQRTLDVCSHHKLSCKLLDALADIDRPADIIALADKVKTGEIDLSASPRTYSFIVKTF